MQSSTLYSNNIVRFLLSMGPFSTQKKGVNTCISNILPVYIKYNNIYDNIVIYLDRRLLHETQNPQ